MKVKSASGLRKNAVGKFGIGLRKRKLCVFKFIEIGKTVKGCENPLCAVDAKYEIVHGPKEGHLFEAKIVFNSCIIYGTKKAAIAGIARMEKAKAKAKAEKAKTKVKAK